MLEVDREEGRAGQAARLSGVLAQLVEARRLDPGPQSWRGPAVYTLQAEALIERPDVA
jgi:hypothetical protein